MFIENSREDNAVYAADIYERAQENVSSIHAHVAIYIDIIYNT